MSKQKKRAKPQPVSPPAPGATPQPAERRPPDPQPAATATPARPLARRLWPLYLLLVFIGLAATGWWLARPAATPPAAPTAAPLVTQPATAAISASPLPIGGVSYCRSNANFAPAVGLGGTINASTSERLIKGLVVYNADLAPEQVQLGASGVYQHPSWDDAGYLGPVATDGLGNIYTAPSPRVSLIDNPPEGANTIYKVDTDTGEMKPLVVLPAAAPPSSGNAYGILGLTYDCDTESLYAATVAGSTRANEVGRLYQIDPKSGAVLSQHDNVDAVGVAVFNGAQGKRLYFGAARAPEVRSLALAEDGGFAGDLRADIFLADLPPYLDLRARRIIFPAKTTDMNVRAVEFNYNLVAMSETRQANYLFSYDPARDGWNIVTE